MEAMLDSNVCIRAMRPTGDDVRAWLAERSDGLCLSAIVVHELLVGAELSARRDFQIKLIGELTARLEVRDFNSLAAGHAAHIRANLQRRGELIGVNDMLIAGHARSLDLKLITSDLVDFRRVDGLRCNDWFSEEPQ